MKFKNIVIVGLSLAVVFLVYDKKVNEQNPFKKKEVVNLTNFRKEDDFSMDKNNKKLDKKIDKLLEDNGYLEIKDEKTKEKIKESVNELLKDDRFKNELKKNSFKLKDGKLNMELDLNDLAERAKDGAEISADFIKEMLNERGTIKSLFLLEYKFIY